MSVPTTAEVEIAEGPGDAISVPLYLSGLAVSLLGILAVNSALEDDQTNSFTLLLTVIGFFFSVACRWMKIKNRIVEILGAGFALYLAYRYLTNSLDLSVFVPPGVTQSDMIMAIVLEWLTVARSWFLMNDEAVVFTSVTSIAMIGLVGASNINTELLVIFFAFTVCATFLLLHQTYLVQRSWAAPAVQGRPESRVIGLQAVLAVFSGILAMMAATVLVIPLRAIGSHLSLSSALKSLVGSQHAGDAVMSDNASTVNLSDDTTFHIGSGDEFSASEQVVMHVTTNPPGEYYYRGRTYDDYIGTGWKSSAEAAPIPLSRAVPTMPLYPKTALFQVADASQPGGDPSQPLPNAQIVRYTHRLIARFAMASGSTSTLYIPYGTTRVDVPSLSGLVLAQTPDNSVTMNVPVGEGNFVYEAFANNVDVPAWTLIAASSGQQSVPPNLRRQYVDQKNEQALTPTDQQRLQSTANMIVQRLPEDRRSEFDIAEAIRTWVSQRAVYSLDVDPVPPGRDAVSYFLFTSRRGYCDLYASSMAILCRYAGIPARVATGFDSGVQNPDGGYDLREIDKHAWVEVWFPQYGWQQFDPTVGTMQASAVDGFKLNFRWLTHVVTAIQLYLELQGVLPIVFAVAILAGLGYIFKIEVYDKFIATGALAQQKSGYRTLAAALKASASSAATYSKGSIQDRYSRFEAIAALAGVRREQSQTPAEFLNLFVSALERPSPELQPHVDELRSAASRLTEDVMAAAYAPIDLVAESLVAIEQGGAGETALAALKKYAPLISKNLRSRQKETAPR